MFITDLLQRNRRNTGTPDPGLWRRQPSKDTLTDRVTDADRHGPEDAGGHGDEDADRQI